MQTQPPCWSEASVHVLVDAVLIMERGTVPAWLVEGPWRRQTAPDHENQGRESGKRHEYRKLASVAEDAEGADADSAGPGREGVGATEIASHEGGANEGERKH